MRWWLAGIEIIDAHSEPLDASAVGPSDEVLCGVCETLMFVGRAARPAARFAGELGDGKPVVCNVCGSPLRTDRHLSRD